MSKTIEDRFWSKVKNFGPKECWNWPSGGRYGRVIVDGKMQGSHRVSWELHNGPIPEGMCVLHACDNPRCCNPAHLWIGTHQDNMDDMVKKGRSIPCGSGGERHGRAKLTDEIVLQCRALYASGVTGVELARKFNVSHAVMHKAIVGTTWKHLILQTAKGE